MSPAPRLIPVAWPEVRSPLAMPVAAMIFSETTSKTANLAMVYGTCLKRMGPNLRTFAVSGASSAGRARG